MDNFVQLSDVLKFGDNLENGQNFNEIPKNSRGVARGGGVDPVGGCNTPHSS
jgi:hypothetical protein